RPRPRRARARRARSLGLSAGRLLRVRGAPRGGVGARVPPAARRARGARRAPAAPPRGAARRPRRRPPRAPPRPHGPPGPPRPRPGRCAPLPARPADAGGVGKGVGGCVRETYGAPVARFQAEHAQDPAVAHLMAGIARDEARHAALSWAVARWAETRLDAAARA